MATIGGGAGPSNAETPFPAFAKLQGEDFEYYMRKYSIILGRKSRKASVDLDLGNCGGGLGISRRHARIYYDFNFMCFALEVLGRKGCLIRNVLFMPGSHPIKLDSQDLVQIGEVRFYFLLPTRSFFETLEAGWKIVPPLLSSQSADPPTSSNVEKKGEEREGDRKESLGISHGEGRVSGLIIQQLDAKETGVFSSEQPGALESARQIVPPKPSQLMVAPLNPSNHEEKGEEKISLKKESLANRHVECGVSGGLIVKEVDAIKAEGSSGVLSGTFEAARQMAPPLIQMVPIAYSNDVKMQDEGECGEEEILGVDHGKGVVSGLIAENFNASKAEGSSGILYGAVIAAKKTEPSLLTPLVVVPLASITDVRKGAGDVSGLIVKESKPAEAEHLSGLPSGSLETAGKITLPLSPQLVVVPPISPINEKKRKEREGDRDENLGTIHGKNVASGLVVEESNAIEAGVLSNEQSGSLEAAKQMEPPLPPELVVDLLTASMGEQEDGDRRASSGFGHGEGDASALIVEELNAEEAGGSPSEQSSSCKIAKQIISPLPPQLIVVPLSISNIEKKGVEEEGDGDGCEGTGHSAVAVTGLIVQDLSTKEAGGLYSEQFGVLQAVSQITSPLLFQPVVVPLTTSNNEKNNADKEGASEKTAGVGHGVGDVTGLILQEFDANEAEGPSDGLSSSLEAARKVASPLPFPLVDDGNKGEERDDGGEKSGGMGFGEADVDGSIVDESNAKETEGSSDMLSGGMQQFSFSDSNQEATPDVHVVKAHLPGINKEQIKLGVEGGKICLQISAPEHTTENTEKTDMRHYVQDGSSMFVRRLSMLPENVKLDQIKAVLENGMLTVTVPVSKGNAERAGPSGVKPIEMSD